MHSNEFAAHERMSLLFSQGNADFQIGKHELYSTPTRKPENTVFASLTRRVTKLRSFKN
jgi:hypothetical protein